MPKKQGRKDSEGDRQNNRRKNLVLKHESFTAVWLGLRTSMIMLAKDLGSAKVGDSIYLITNESEDGKEILPTKILGCTKVKLADVFKMSAKKLKKHAVKTGMDLYKRSLFLLNEQVNEDSDCVIVDIEAPEAATAIEWLGQVISTKLAEIMDEDDFAFDYNAYYDAEKRAVQRNLQFLFKEPIPQNALDDLDDWLEPVCKDFHFFDVEDSYPEEQEWEDDEEPEEDWGGHDDDGDAVLDFAVDDDSEEDEDDEEEFDSGSGYVDEQDREHDVLVDSIEINDGPMALMDRIIAQGQVDPEEYGFQPPPGYKPPKYKMK